MEQLVLMEQLARKAMLEPLDLTEQPVLVVFKARLVLLDLMEQQAHRAT
jgi:hypothetical protein